MKRIKNYQYVTLFSGKSRYWHKSIILMLGKLPDYDNPYPYDRNTVHERIENISNPEEIVKAMDEDEGKDERGYVFQMTVSPEWGRCVPGRGWRLKPQLLIQKS